MRTSPRLTHLNGLAGLRAVAVLAVIGYHYVPSAYPGGFVGVDVFFVLSGFLITSLLLAEHASTGGVNLRTFWVRRARRLLPALALVVLVCSSTAWLLGGDVLYRIGAQILGAATFTSNWVAIATESSYFGAGAPELFRNLWSLAVEEQFYLIWPFLFLGLLALVRRPGARAATIGGLGALSVLAAAMLVVPGQDPSRVYYGSDTHAFGLALGAALAFLLPARTAVPSHGAGQEAQGRQLRRHSWWGVGGVAVILAAGVLLGDRWAGTYPWGLLAVSAATAFVIWVVVPAPGGFGRVLDARPLRYIGVRSYGLYLWHWPVLVLLQSAFPAWPRAGLPALALAAVALAISSAAAILSYRYLEDPIRRRGFRGSVRLLRARVRGSRPAAVTASVAVLILLGGGSVGTAAAVAASSDTTSTERLLAEAQRALAASSPEIPATDPGAAAPGATDPGVTDQGAVPPPAPSAPQTADEAAAPGAPSPAGIAPPPGEAITAIGDSVMLASAPALQAAFPGIALDATVSRQMNEAPGIVQSLADAGALRQTLVVGLGTNGPFGGGITDQIRSIAGPGRDVVFVTMSAPSEWTDSVNAQLRDLAAREPHVALCDWQSAIAPHLDLLAEDQIHPGSEGAAIYAECVRGAFAQLEPRG